MVKRRIFLIVLDSFGIGEAPDAEEFGDRGCHTLHTILKSPEYQTPVLERLGLFRIEGAPQQKGGGVLTGSFGRMQEASRGKDNHRTLGNSRNCFQKTASSLYGRFSGIHHQRI